MHGVTIPDFIAKSEELDVIQLPGLNINHGAQAGSNPGNHNLPGETKLMGNAWPGWRLTTAIQRYVCTRSA